MKTDVTGPFSGNCLRSMGQIWNKQQGVAENNSAHLSAIL
jgi:hypothetical protein